MASGMTGKEVRLLVDDFIGTTSDGYLCHFSYSTHESFYHRYCELDVDVRTYRAKYGSTRKTFEAILHAVKPIDQAKIIRGVMDFLAEKSATGSAADKREKVRSALMAAAVRLETNGIVQTPQLVVSTDTVQEALRDAQLLLDSHGARNALDRAHTALHGYLKKICQDRDLIIHDDPSMTELFGVIRDQFEEFKILIVHDKEARKFFGSLATALDSLNFIRNRGTLAHPNELILADEEAMLYINLSRAILGYLDKKLASPTVPKKSLEPESIPF